MVPFHPVIVHFPIALTFVLPVLILVFAYMIKVNKMAPKGWLIIIGLQLAVVITGYISLESGETEEETISKVVAKELIHAHEEAGEIFVGSAVIALVLSVAAFFIRKEIGFPVKIVVALITLISSYLAYKAGNLGGELVYRHGAGSVYCEEVSHGILPTPNQTTSESPVHENESLKPDENDYGNSDDEGLDDDGLKQED